MPERWQAELRKLRAVEPPPSMWDRARTRSTGDGEPPLRHRVLAAAVAFALFLGAGAFAWTALRPVDQPDRPGVAEAPPVVTVTFSDMDPEYPDYPYAYLAFDGERERGKFWSFGWDGSIIDTSTPVIRRFVRVPAGARLEIAGNANLVEGFVGGLEFPFRRIEPLAADGEDLLDLPPGRHTLVFEATFGARGSVPFAFGIEIVEQGTTDTQPLVIVTRLAAPVGGVCCDIDAYARYGDDRVALDPIDTPGEEFGYPAAVLAVPISAGTPISLEGNATSVTVRPLSPAEADLVDNAATWAGSPIDRLSLEAGTHALGIEVEWADDVVGVRSSATFGVIVSVVEATDDRRQPDTAGSADVLRILCRDGGASVPTPVVVAQPEGVRVSIENGGNAVALVFHGLDDASTFGGPIEGASRAWPIDPGRFEVGCLEDARQSYGDVPTATIEVVDPNGYWVGFSAECDGEGVREFAAYDGGGADYVDDPSAIRGTLTGLGDGDVVRLPGYVEGSGSMDGRYVIVRDGRVIGHVFVGLSGADDPGGAGLTEVTGEGCAGSGLAGISERDDSRLRCVTSEPEAFPAPEGPRILPGGEAFINGNLPGVRMDDEVRQISFIEGEEWDGVWSVARGGRLVALVAYPSLDGIACNGSGIGGT